MQNLKSRATVSYTCFKETSLHVSREVPDPVDLTWGWRTLPAQVEIVTVPRMIPMRLVVPSRICLGWLRSARHHTSGKWKPVQWGPEEFVLGWTQSGSKIRFRLYSVVSCDHWDLVLCGGNTTLQEDLYRCECGFGNRLNCLWQLLVCVPFDQETTVNHFLHQNPQLSDSTMSFDRSVHDKQSMVHDKKDGRVTSPAHQSHLHHSIINGSQGTGMKPQGISLGHVHEINTFIQNTTRVK